MNFLQLDKDSYWINSVRKIENKEKERKLSIMILGKWRKNETTLWILVTFNISLQECKNHGHVWNIITTKFYDLRHTPRNSSLHTNVERTFVHNVCLPESRCDENTDLLPVFQPIKKKWWNLNFISVLWLVEK